MIDQASWADVRDGANRVITRCVEGGGGEASGIDEGGSRGGKVRIGAYGALVVLVGHWFDEQDPQVLGRAMGLGEEGEANMTVVSANQAVTSRVKKWRRREAS